MMVLVEHAQMATLPKVGLTPEQYLDFERKSDTKHEYWDGHMWAMSGGTFRHGAICTNIILAAGTALRGTPCRPFTSDLRLAVSAHGLYTYPDSIIVCGPPELLNFDTITNPVVIFEVLSPSTAAYDRGEKFRHYRAISALREYVLVSQDAYLVERYERQADDRWLLSESSGLDGLVTLASVSCTLALREIYANVDMSESAV